MCMEWRPVLTRAKSWLTAYGNNKAEIYINRVQLEEVKSLGVDATLSKEESFTADIRIRIASEPAVMTRIWPGNTITFATKY